MGTWVWKPSSHSCLFDLRALYTLLNNCQLDAGAEVSTETSVDLFISGSLGSQGQGKGLLLCLNNVPLSGAGSVHRVQDPETEEKEGNFRVLGDVQDHSGKQPCR